MPAFEPARFSVIVGSLSPETATEVRELAALVAQYDDVAPLSEVPMLQLSETKPWLTHVAVREKLDHDWEQPLLAYAQVDRSGESAVLELAVHPRWRRHGIGSQLLALAEADARLPGQAGKGLSAGQELRVWAHGDIEAAQQFAATKGYTAVRELLFLKRPLSCPDAHLGGIAAAGALKGSTAPLPAGYKLRGIQLDADGQAWVELNGVVFADHPEQGRLTVEDLNRRRAEPWFDPNHFQVIVEESSGQLVAFCWTKVADEHQGEIYAIGVHPAHQRRGLAAHLLESAFELMAHEGLRDATLYVEGSNEAALAAYYTAGFTPVTADVQYARRK